MAGHSSRTFANSASRRAAWRRTSSCKNGKNGKCGKMAEWKTGGDGGIGTKIGLKSRSLVAETEKPDPGHPTTRFRILTLTFSRLWRSSSSRPASSPRRGRKAGERRGEGVDVSSQEGSWKEGEDELEAGAGLKKTRKWAQLRLCTFWKRKNGNPKTSLDLLVQLQVWFPAASRVVESGTYLPPGLYPPTGSSPAGDPSSSSSSSLRAIRKPPRLSCWKCAVTSSGRQEILTGPHGTAVRRGKSLRLCRQKAQ